MNLKRRMNMGISPGKSKRKRSLRHSISIGAMLVSIIGIMILVLITVLWFLNYRQQKRSELSAILADSVQSCTEDMTAVTEYITDLFANNRDFSELSKSWSMEETTEDYLRVYDLNETLELQFRQSGALSAYILLYHSGQNARYNSDSSRVPVQDMKELRSIVTKMGYSSASASAEWLFTVVNGNLYGLWIRARGSAAICGIYSFQNMETRLREWAGDDADVFYINGQRVMETSDISEENRNEGGRYVKALINADQVFADHSMDCYRYGQLIENTELWVCLKVPARISDYVTGPLIAMLLLWLLCIWMTWCGGRSLKRGVIGPLENLVETMNRIRSGEWDAAMDSETCFEELDRVSEALKVMVAEIQRQKMVSYEERIEKQQAQMQYLQLQLRPHFYLNSLKTLNVLLKSGENEKGEDLIIRLSRHLRYLLQSERETVLLEEEIDYVKNYAALQQDMTGRSISIRWNIQPELKTWMVPTLCIQTFVENSLKYARLGSAEQCLIISVSINELDMGEIVFLDLQVQDNGEGYPDEVLAEISEEPREGSRMVGINNIKRRCRFLYGDAAQFAFYNEDGAVSELLLPQREEEQ